MARLSNYELLRIASLMLIIGIHVSAEPLKAIPVSSVNWYVANLVDSICRPGVNIFVLVGAFFMVDMNRFDIRVWKRVWRIIYPLAVYILVLASYVILVESVDVPWLSFLQSILNGKLGVLGPIWYGHLWFIYPYLVLIVISPILNMVVEAADKRTFHLIMLVLLTFFVFFPTINDYSRMALVYVPISSIGLFVTLYFTAAYIKKFSVQIKFWKGALLFLLCGVTVSLLTWFYTDQLISPEASPHGLVLNFYHYNGILVYAASVAIFLGIRSISLQSRTVNFVGRATYDAYLVHTIFIYVLGTWIVYTDYYYESVITFIAITLGLITLITGCSLFYGMLRAGMDAGLKMIWNKTSFSQWLRVRIEPEEKK